MVFRIYACPFFAEICHFELVMATLMGLVEVFNSTESSLRLWRNSSVHEYPPYTFIGGMTVFYVMKGSSCWPRIFQITSTGLHTPTSMISPQEDHRKGIH